MNIYHCTFAPNSDLANIQREDLIADNIQQIERVYQANDCTLLRFNVNTAEVATGAPDAEQTYQEFQSLAEKYAPKSMTPRNTPETCDHRRVFARTNGMYCPDCWTTRPVANDFEKRTSAPHRDNGYVNWSMR